MKSLLGWVIGPLLLLFCSCLIEIDPVGGRGSEKLPGRKLAEFLAVSLTELAARLETATKAAPKVRNGLAQGVSPGESERSGQVPRDDRNRRPRLESRDPSREKRRLARDEKAKGQEPKA